MGERVEYKAVSATNAGSLTNEVNELLSQGWELFGGVSVAGSTSGIQYAQALTRRASEAE